MPNVIGIRFKDSGKTYYFAPTGVELAQGDYVVVDTARGPELARVAFPAHDVPPSELTADLKPVVRAADRADFDRLAQLNSREQEVLSRCAEKIREHVLPMRLVKAEYSFDGSRLTFFFTAEKRVDFRVLVRDLARTFRTRIELRQIGPRDEAKLLGGIGPCGRLLCCATFLPDYARVSIKMAKDQDLPLNPTKISGVCGRLLCCLAYEHEQYLQVKAELPRRGAWVQTPDGPGEVVSVNVLSETVMVELASSGIQEEFAPSLLSEATERVASLARERNDLGITPVRPPRREEPRRSPDRGERRLLRDTIDTEVLDALALLEDGMEALDDGAARKAQRPAEPQVPSGQSDPLRQGDTPRQGRALTQQGRTASTPQTRRPSSARPPLPGHSRQPPATQTGSEPASQDQIVRRPHRRRRDKDGA